jgi:GT2 family glycosyltransferase
MNSVSDGLVTVVIANFNRCDDLRAAIRSVKEQEYPNIEILIVDNASSDNSRTMLASEFPDVCVIALNENRGMDGYSVGFQRANGAFIFQMDNDSLMPDTTVLSEVVKCFQQGPENLAVVATRVEEYQEGLHSVFELRCRDKRQGPMNTGGFHAGGVAFRRACFDQIGYYNRDVFLYGSELFLQMKFLAAGLRIQYYPEILMLHKSSNVARSPRCLYYELRNRYWLMRYFGTGLQQLRFFPAMIIHDIVYSLHKKAMKVFLKAFRDGFGPLPESLKPPLRSLEPDFINKIWEFGEAFSVLPLRRISKQELREIGDKT